MHFLQVISENIPEILKKESQTKIEMYIRQIKLVWFHEGEEKTTEKFNNEASFHPDNEGLNQWESTCLVCVKTLTSVPGDTQQKTSKKHKLTFSLITLLKKVPRGFRSI